MTTFAFSQVDVFAAAPLAGNPVAVVHGADTLTDARMAAFARWTNLSETTFLLEPTDARADYRLRIFTPGGELPFAGHPTLGSAHAWLERGGTPASGSNLVQECGIGLVELRRDGDRLAFRAPGLLRSGPVDPDTVAAAARSLGLAPGQVRASNWVDNGPGWLGLLLDSARTVLDVRPDYVAMGELNIGIIGAFPENGPADFEVRAFCPSLAVPEDPVTGSLNAGFAVWLTRDGLAPADYRVRQGTAMQREGQVHISTDTEGELWVGGTSTTLIRGTLSL